MAIKGITEARWEYCQMINVRTICPIDINEEYLISKLSSLFISWFPTEDNEFYIGSEVSLLIKYLEIYDQVWSTRDLNNIVAIKG